jgi:hypothetical protein
MRSTDSPTGLQRVMSMLRDYRVLKFIIAILIIVWLSGFW